MPFIGGVLSGSFGSYRYLNRSSEDFACGDDFILLLEKAGFRLCECHPLGFGAVSIYVGVKS